MNRALRSVLGRRANACRRLAGAVVAVVCAIAALVAIQTADNLEQRGIVSGFDYLSRAAGFEIAAGPLSYSSRDSYTRALAVGLVNTLRVSLPGILVATALGIVIGVARLSKIWVVSATARAYVEIMRNTPLLLQLLFWYSLSQSLPEPRAALSPLPGVFLCFRGLFLPRLAWHDDSLGLEHPALCRLRLSGGHVDLPGVRRTPHRALDVHRRLHRRDRPRRHSLGRQRPDGGGGGARLVPRRALRLVVLPQACP